MSGRNAVPIDAEVKAVMDEYGIGPHECWQVPGGKSYAIKHSAIERVIAQRGIWFDPPQVLEGSTPDKAIAILVIGHMGDDRKEWSIGEASAANCQNKYFWAMAEKRAKDRVALKLLRAHGIYSEDEADSFSEPARRVDDRSDARAYVARCKTELQQIESVEELRAWWRTEAKNRQLHDLSKEAGDPLYGDIYAAMLARGEALSGPQREAAQ